MYLQNYGDAFTDGIQYLIAVGSIIGLLGLILGFLLMLLGSKKRMNVALAMILFSFLLVSICGFDTGVKYFRIRTH